MTVQLINPNLHVLLIHYPIALTFLGMLIEFFSFLWRRSGFRAAGRWMILIGALASIPAATTGLFAARQVLGGTPDQTWEQTKQSAHFSNEQWDSLREHVQFNALAVAILAFLVVGWLGSSDRQRGRLHLLFLLALVAAMALMAAAAWHGGEMVYAHGTGINLVKGGWPIEPEVDSRKASTTSPTSRREDSSDDPSQVKWLFNGLHEAAGQVGKVDSVVDVHVMLAGWTVALALASLGLSFRMLSTDRSSEFDDLHATDDDIVDALVPRSTGMEQRSLLEPSERPVHDAPAAPMPSARFWLLVVLLALATAIAGWMIVGPESLGSAKQMLRDENRNLVHAIAGVSILALSLILALVTRVAPRNRGLVSCLAILLVTAIAIQIWMGILLLYDTPSGPLNHFNVPATQAA